MAGHYTYPFKPIQAGPSTKEANQVLANHGYQLKKQTAPFGGGPSRHETGASPKHYALAGSARSRGRGLLEELEDLLGLLVRLGKHGVACLGQYPVLGEFDHLAGHVCIADTTLGSLKIFCADVYSLDRML
jgi:hypothetical protein